MPGLYLQFAEDLHTAGEGETKMQSIKKKNKAVVIIRRIVIIVLISVCIGLLLFISFFPHFLPLGIKRHNVQDYISGNYTSFRSGKTAAAFFPSPDELGDYESLDFYFVNNAFRFSFISGRYGNTFMLEAVYDEKNFDAAVLNMISHYKCGDLYEENKLNLFWRWDYFFIEFKAGTFDKNQSFFLCINEKESKIRFLYMENAVVNSQLRMISDFNMDSWDTKVSVNDPYYVESAKEKYESYIRR